MPYLLTEDGNELFYNDWGSGRPVVLIHGWPLQSASWEYQARVLAEAGYRVISYDRRGFGKSDQPFDGYDYDTLAADLATVLDDLELTNVTLVGFSMGGGEVARYVGKYGTERVAQAVLISAVTPYLLKTDDNPEGVEQKVFDGMLDGIKKGRADFMEKFSSMFYGRTMVNHTVSQPELDFWQAQAMQGSPKATLDCVTAFSSTDFREDLAKFDVPTLIIHGTSDGTVPIDNSARRAVKLIPGGELLEYEGEAHGLNVTAAEKLNQDLLAFLSK